MFRQWPLTGRDEELSIVGAAVGSDRKPRPGVIVAGAAGVGKTRLVRAVLDRMEAAGTDVRWVVATQSARAIPMGVFSRYLARSASAESMQAVAVRAAGILGRPVDGRRVVVGIDDAHLLDDQSAMVVLQLVLARVATVVMTLRADIPTCDAVTTMWKDDYLERIDLQPLSPAATERLLEAALGGHVEHATADRLWHLSGGRSLFLRHLVDTELDAGRLTRDFGVWRWRGGPDLSTRLTTLIEAQMGRMEPAVREVVDLLSIAEPLDVRVLDELIGRAATEEAEARGLVTVGRLAGGELSARLAHPLYGEVRRSRLGLLQGRQLRGRIATAMAHSPNCTEENVLRRALLTADSDLPPDSGLYLGAARAARARGDIELCDQLARASVVAEGGFDAKSLLVHSLVARGDGVRAEAELAILSRLARDDRQRLSVAVDRVTNLFWDLGRTEDARHVLDSALTTLIDLDARRTLVALRAVLDFCEGHMQSAVDAARLALGDGQAPDTVVAHACYALVGALGALGRTDEIEEFAERGYRAAASRETGIGPVSFQLQHVNALVNAGYLAVAEKVAACARKDTAPAPTSVGLKAALVCGRVAVRCGRLPEAIRLLREARAGLGRQGSLGMGYACALTLAQSYAFIGDGEAAQRALEDAEGMRHAGFAVLDVDRCRVAAWVLAARGRVGAGRATARDAAELAAEREQVALEMLAWHTAVRMGDSGCAPRLTELAEEVDGPAAPAVARHATALAAGDGQALDAVSEQFEENRDMLSAVDAASQAAAVHLENGCRGSALAAAARARRLARDCGAKTPALAAITAIDLPITARQREIARLVASGMTNQQIAEQLVMSVRTVEGHIYHAGRRLGVNSRAELAHLVCTDEVRPCGVQGT